MIREVWKQRLTRFDRSLVILLLVLILFSFRLPLAAGKGDQVIISVAGRVKFVAPLNQEREVSLSGPLGETRLRIADGGIRVISSPCPKKICLGMGPARRSGDLLACIPNQVVVRIQGTGRQEAGYDLLSH